MAELDPSADVPPEPLRPWQFRLRALFVVTFVVAAMCSLAALVGPIGPIALGVIAVSILAVRNWVNIIPAAFVVVVVLMLLAMLLPDVGSRGPTRRGACANNLKQLGLALLNYHEANGCFPPAYVADESGRPMHSWRMLIMPYLERNKLYETYRFDEPWDGPNNRKLHGVYPNVLRCPADGKAAKKNDSGQLARTSYVAVVGPGTAWPDAESSCLDDFTDALGNTILLVEVVDSGIHWMEPHDLHITQMAPVVNPKSGQGVSSRHGTTVNVVFADGHIEHLPADVSPAELRALLTPGGGEEIEGRGR